jgi:pimeloyl-ACP methyl ester carboxylesterase
VIGLDCRGHGLSAKPHDPNAYTMDVMATDVINLLDELRIASARYLGYSMGARIGLQAVVDSPARVQSAVLGGIGMSGAIEEAEQIARALRGGEAEGASALSFQRFASARETNDLEALATCMEGMAKSAAVNPKRLAAITTPILVVVGDRDEVARDAAQLAERIPAARLVTIPGRDHLGTVPARQFKEAAVEFFSAS